MYAFNRLDASVENSFITSLKTDGFHRLKKEEEKRNSVTNNMISSNLYFNTPRLKTGIIVVYNVFNKVLNPSFRPYTAIIRGETAFTMQVFITNISSDALRFPEKPLSTRRGGLLPSVN